MILKCEDWFHLTGIFFFFFLNFNTGLEPSEALAVIQKNFSSSGPGVSVYVGARDNFAISRPNQTAFSPNIFWHSTELLEDSLYVFFYLLGILLNRQNFLLKQIILLLSPF